MLTNINETFAGSKLISEMNIGTNQNVSMSKCISYNEFDHKVIKSVIVNTFLTLLQTNLFTYRNYSEMCIMQMFSSHMVVHPFCAQSS